MIDLTSFLYSLYVISDTHENDPNEDSKCQESAGLTLLSDDNPWLLCVF